MSATPVQPDWPQPSHPGLIEVRHTPSASAGDFATSAHSLVSLPPGALFAKLTTPPLTLTPTKAYSSIQISRTEHAELHSDLLYVNHSCAPALVFDMGAMAVRVAPDRALAAGDELTFFYPSSEWEMAQPFACRCGAGEGVCKGWIAGARDMGRERMRGMWLNKFIEEMLDEQEAATSTSTTESTVISEASASAQSGPAPAQERGGWCSIQ